jgi:hypothetical protein
MSGENPLHSKPGKDAFIHDIVGTSSRLLVQQDMLAKTFDAAHHFALNAHTRLA